MATLITGQKAPSWRASKRAIHVPCSSVSRRSIGVLGVATALFPPLSIASPRPSSIYDFTVKQYGEDVPLSKFKGQSLIIVNVASE